MGEVLVRHQRGIPLVVTEDGKRVVFGDEVGWVVLFDSTSGDVLR